MIMYVKNLLLKMLVMSVCTIAFLLIFQGPGSKVYAATYYVDQNAAGASDNNPGTEASPWLTISKAASTLTAGDTVYVKEGVYREFVRPANSGTAGKPITYEAYPGDTVVITGADVVSGWTLDSGYVYKKTGFDPANQQSNPVVREYDTFDLYLINNDIQMVIQEDDVYNPVVLTKVTSRGSMTAGTFYMDVANNVLYVWMTDNSNPGTKTIQAGVRNFIFRTVSADGTRRSYMTIKGFQMRYNNMQLYPYPWAALNVVGDHLTVENNIVTWCNQSGCGMSGSYNVVKNNICSYNGFHGFQISGGDNFLVDGNTTEHNNLFHWDMAWDGGGGKYTVLSDSVVRNHTSAYNLGPGLWFDIDVTNCIIENSCFHDNIGPGIMNEISYDNIIRNNLVYRNNCAADVPVKNPVFGDPNYTWAVTGTTSDTRDYAAYAIYNSSSPGTDIYNNTVVQNGYDYPTVNVSSSGIVVSGALRGDASTHDVTVKNNIIVNNGQCQLNMRQNGYDAYTYDNFSDYNLIYQNNGSNLAALSGVYYNSLASWYSATGFDANSVNQDPLFADTGSCTYDFYLKQNSPAINAGDDLTDVLYDCEGTVRGLGAGYDMGAYEFSGGIIMVNPNDAGVTTVLNDTGANGSVQISNYRVVLPDVGDKVQIAFSVPSDGYYILEVKDRSGYYNTGTSTAYKDLYWNADVNRYVLDNHYILDFVGDVDTVGQNSGVEFWGIVKMEAPVFLTTGSHTMTIECTSYSWSMISYPAIKQVPGKAVNPNGNTTVLNDTGANGSVYVGNYYLLLPDAGDKVRISFSVDTAGYYYIQTEERSGVSGYNTWYWDQSSYKYILDTKTTVKLTGDTETVWNRAGIEFWGLANSDNAVFLTAGTHDITCELTSGSWGMLHHIGIWQAPGKAVNPNGNTTVLNETGGNGSVVISNWYVLLPDMGDKVRINFTVDSDGFYTIDSKVRSGTSGIFDYYWTRGAYTFNIDGTTPVTLEGDAASIGPLYNSEYWGMARTDVPVYLTAGSHYITLESSTDSWIMIAYVGINSVDSNRIPSMFEAESLTVNSISSGDTHTVTANSNMSGGYGDMFNANAVNDYMEYQVDVPVTGTYNVKVKVNKNSDRGIFQLAVDGTNQGSTQDNYSASSVYAEFDLGNVTFTSTGNHLFRFRITGKNAGSSGYKLFIDYIRLTKQ